MGRRRCREARCRDCGSVWRTSDASASSAELTCKPAHCHTATAAWAGPCLDDATGFGSPAFSNARGNLNLSNVHTLLGTAGW